MKRDTLENRPHLIPAVIAALALLGALAPWPYGYFQLLRFVVCPVSAYVAYFAYNWQKLWATWLFGFIAVLFNPLIPIHLSRELWQPIDTVCALLFAAVAFILRKPKEGQAGERVTLESEIRDSNTCRLCHAVSELKESHIIPRSIIKLIRDETLDNRFYELHNKLYQTIQDWPKEYLLCYDCEQKIGRYEKYFKEAIHLSRHGIEIKHNRQFAVIDNLDYSKLKLFFLSMLWRMSISSRTEFENVNIGDNEETIRKMIVKEEPGKSSEYPVNAIIPLFNGKPEEAWSTTALVSESRPPVYAIVIGGILYYISTARQNNSFLAEPFMSLIPELLLNESGRWVIPLADLNSIPCLREFIDQQFNE